MPSETPAVDKNLRFTTVNWGMVLRGFINLQNMTVWSTENLHSLAFWRSRRIGSSQCNDNNKSYTFRKLLIIILFWVILTYAVFLGNIHSAKYWDRHLQSFLNLLYEWCSQTISNRMMQLSLTWWTRNYQIFNNFLSSQTLWLVIFSIFFCNNEVIYLTGLII